MRAVIWKRSAQAQFRSLLDYVSDHDEAAADRLKADFEERIARLAEWPGMGRLGRVPGTREFVLHPNYIAIYEVVGDRVIMLRILHARRRYP
jgi:toxin ParE1/3/4